MRRRRRGVDGARRPRPLTARRAGFCSAWSSSSRRSTSSRCTPCRSPARARWPTCARTSSSSCSAPSSASSTAAGRPPGHPRHQRRRRHRRAVRLGRAQRDRRSRRARRHRRDDAAARLAHVAHRLRRAARRSALFVTGTCAPGPRGLPRHPRQDRAAQRLPQRAGLGHGRGAGLRAREARRRRVRRDQRRVPRRQQPRRSTTRPSLDAAIEMVGTVCIALDPLVGGHAPLVDAFGMVVAFIAYIEQFFEPDQRPVAALHPAAVAR